MHYSLLFVIKHFEAVYLLSLRLYLLPSIFLLMILYELDSAVFKGFLQVNITCKLAWNVTKTEIAKSRWMSTQVAWLCIRPQNCINCHVRTGSLRHAQLPSKLSKSFIPSFIFYAQFLPLSRVLNLSREEHWLLARLLAAVRWRSGGNQDYNDLQYRTKLVRTLELDHVSDKMFRVLSTA